jgi:hypothetical protein
MTLAKAVGFVIASSSLDRQERSTIRRENLRATFRFPVLQFDAFRRIAFRL